MEKGTDRKCRDERSYCRRENIAGKRPRGGEEHNTEADGRVGFQTVGSPRVDKDTVHRSILMRVIWRPPLVGGRGERAGRRHHCVAHTLNTNAPPPLLENAVKVTLRN